MPCGRPTPCFSTLHAKAAGRGPSMRSLERACLPSGICRAIRRRWRAIWLACGVPVTDSRACSRTICSRKRVTLRRSQRCGGAPSPKAEAKWTMPAPDLDVRYVARLARLALTDEEARVFGAQLAGILEHVSALNGLDTSDVAATAQVVESRNAWRDDAVAACRASSEKVGERLRRRARGQRPRTLCA